MKKHISGFLTAVLVLNPFTAQVRAETSSDSVRETAKSLSPIEAATVASLSKPLIRALIALDGQTKATNILARMRLGNVVDEAVSEFGENIEAIAKNNPAGVARMYLILAIKEMKSNDSVNLLSNKAISKTLQDKMNTEIKRRSQVVHPLVAVSSGVLIGGVIGVFVARQSFTMEPQIYPYSAQAQRMIAIAVGGTLGAAAAGGGLFFYLNDGANYDADQIIAELDADKDLYNLVD